MEIVETINKSGATVLAIGVGAPKQEKWICRYKDKLPNIKIFLAVGATIDFEAGQKKRSPKWVSEIGLEWLHRLLSEPKRLWKRYLLDDSLFFWLILKQKLHLYQFPFANVQDSLEPYKIQNQWVSKVASSNEIERFNNPSNLLKNQKSTQPALNVSSSATEVKDAATVVVLDHL